MHQELNLSDPHLINARTHFESGNLLAADLAYSEVLRVVPEQLEAINFRALYALNTGRVQDALQGLRRALEIAPADEACRQHLGMALHVDGQQEEAAAVLQSLLSENPDLHLARLHFGGACEALGRLDEAITAYFGAISTAQIKGKWLGVTEIPSGLRSRVLHAMGVVNRGRQAHFRKLIEPLRKTYGVDSLRRVEVALDMYLGERPVNYADLRQKPTFMYFPGLSAQPVHATEQFEWMNEFQAAIPSIREELHEVLARPDGVQPFNRYNSKSEESRHLSGGSAGPNWDAYFFFRHGASVKENVLRCPSTVAALEKLPLVRIRQHAPEICFSMLTPGTHILPHRGVTNTRLVAHLPLIIPPGDCVLRVAGEEHRWCEGLGLVFDDTYEHEAWNRTDTLRAILLLDFWHPDLDECERAALVDLVAGIGDFNASAGLARDKNIHGEN